MLRTGKSHDPKGRSSSRFDAGLSTDAGAQLPGSLTTTWTALAPAGDNRLTHQAKWHHPFRPDTLGTLPRSVEVGLVIPSGFRREFDGLIWPRAVATPPDHTVVLILPFW